MVNRKRDTENTFSFHGTSNKASSKFVRIYKMAVRSGDSGTVFAENGIERVAHPANRSGFAGSGTSHFSFDGSTFCVDKCANGRGFYGTHHTVTLVVL